MASARLRKQRGQGVERRVDIGAFVDPLLKKGLETRVQRDGAVELRVVAGGIGADADQVAVALITREQLLEALCAALVIAFGLAARLYLERLQLLFVPKIAAVLIAVILMMTLISLASAEVGFTSGLSVSLFPMVVLAWIIERLSVVWEENGPQDALPQALGTVAALDAGTGDDTVQGGGGNNVIFGDSGDDRILCAYGGNDRLYGGAGSDLLSGGAGDDIIYAGDDNDQLVGGTGKDLLYGGRGSDTFKYYDWDIDGTKSPDTIADFNRAQGDRIDLEHIDGAAERGL